MSNGHVIDLRNPQPVQGLGTGQRHRITVRWEVVPIIFVPGIMGSRLKKRHKGVWKKAWDPDAPGFMFNHFGWFPIDAAEKKAHMVGAAFDPEYLQPYNDDAEHNAEHIRNARWIERGWGGVAWEIYGSLLRRLSRDDTSDSLVSRLLSPADGTGFETPVHAFAYNWTASNDTSGAKLAAYIQQTIDGYRQKGRVCSQVILVTHSMGGLVARAACMLHGAARLVLGVVHGVQPATGSAAAYWRMRAGFPRTHWWNPKDHASAWVLGTNGREVTALLGNMPGGLELLPNQLYTDNRGRSAWLEWPESRDAAVALPQSGDPYTEIYLERTADWRLIQDERWLDPAAAIGDRPTRRRRGSSAGSLPWREFTERIGLVKGFHARLAAKQHPRTRHFYGTGEATPASIAFEVDWSYDADRRSYEPGLPLNLRPRTAAERCAELNDAEGNRGSFTYYRPIPRNGRTDYRYSPAHGVVRLRLRHPEDFDAGSQDGDGTVPASSGRSLGRSMPPEACVALSGFTHDKAYQDGAAQDLVARCISAWLAERAQAVRAAAS